MSEHQNGSVISHGVDGRRAGNIADDMLQGADAIAAFMGLSPRQVYHQQKRLPVFNIGSMLCARRSTLLAWVEEQEKKAAAKAEA